MFFVKPIMPDLTFKLVLVTNDANLKLAEVINPHRKLQIVLTWTTDDITLQESKI